MERTITAQLTIDIKPIEIDGKFWIMVITDGREINWRGPFSDADTAETVANRLMRFSRALTNSHQSRGSNHG
jgi:hypothetical protein